MKVFVVWQEGNNSWYAGEVIAAFSNKEKAEDFIKIKHNGREDYNIKEVELDAAW